MLGMPGKCCTTALHSHPVLGLLRQGIILAQARFELAVYLSLPDVLLQVLGAPDIVSQIREGKLSAHP